MPYLGAEISLLVSPLRVSSFLPEQGVASVPLPEEVPGHTGLSPPAHLHLHLPADQVPDRRKTPVTPGEAAHKLQTLML